MKSGCAHRPVIGLAAVLALAGAQGAWGQGSAPLQVPLTADPVNRAVLFGAAYANAPTIPSDRSVGMVFLPGRGLVTWEASGKSPEELKEAETQAIGLADARAVQAAIDGRYANDLADAAAQSAEADREEGRLRSDRRSVAALNLAPITGVREQAGGVLPLNRAATKAQIAKALGVRDGAALKDKGRLYFFGAVSGRGVGMNLMHDSGGVLDGWRNAGLTSDEGGFQGLRQTGIAWRNGSAQAALSLIDEKTRAQLLGITAIRDKRLMLSFTVTPKVGP